MSIINDALKKAQKQMDEKETPRITTEEKPSFTDVENTTSQQLSQTPPPAANLDKTPPSPHKTSKSTIPPLKIIQWALMSIIIAISLWFIQRYYSQTNALMPTSVATSPTKMTQPIAKIIETESIEDSLRKTIHISGTMMMEDKRVAVINNTIVNIGDQIEGWTISEITLQNILLTKDGKDIQLKVKK